MPLITRALWLLSPERAHEVAMAALRLLGAVEPLRARLTGALGADDPALVTDVLGLRFTSPVCLAAGFDKDAAAFDGLAALGFGAIEVGTLTAHGQPGNLRPRLFRLPRDRALVNRMGFNNHGARAARERLERRRTSTVIGVNVGRTKSVSNERALDDYAETVSVLAPVADYLVVNVSSPNTPGLRELQAVEQLRPLLERVVTAASAALAPDPRPPVLVKIAPDATDPQIDAIADLAIEVGLEGIVAVNTTIARSGLLSPPADIERTGDGGLSGAPLSTRAEEVLRRLHARCGDRLVLVSAGGIMNAEDAWRRVLAGASLVQLYTGFVYGGPLLPSRIGSGLAVRARRAGYARVQAAVGSGAGGASAG